MWRGRLDISTKEHIFPVEVILSFCSFVLLFHKMSFCYCMGGFQFKKTAFSFYLTGQKRVNRSIQSIFLYIYMVYAFLFCIFSAYMQFNLKRMTNHSAESVKSFSACRFVFLFQTPEKCLFSGKIPACKLRAGFIWLLFPFQNPVTSCKPEPFSSLRIESLRAAGRAWTDDGGQAFLRMSCHFVIPEGLYGCVILVRSVIYVQIRDSQGCENDIVSECQQHAGLGFNIF